MRYERKNVDHYEDYMTNYSMNSLLAKTSAYLNLTYQQIKDLNRMIFHDYSLFDEADEVYERIMEAIDTNEKICIYGDYDMDGIFATTILVKAFMMLGVKVGYHIPNRFSDGYGLNEERVEQMYEKGYTLIITVDNGISAFDAIDKANELGVDVIVTDHHALKDDLPLAYAMLHTKLSKNYPFKEISGGVVAYKLATKLLGKHDKYLFALASCTIISDMMPLLDENRAMVKKGLMLLNSEHFPAFNLLVNDSSKQYTATTIAFEIAPKVNSVGRLPDLMNPNKCVQYFLYGDKQTASLNEFASIMKSLNNKRQTLTTQYYNSLNEDLKDEDYIFLYEKPVHEGIIGLLAGKFSNEYHKVSFIMNYDEKNNIYKGSARSIPGFKLHDFLLSCTDDLAAFGGHDLAAGFSVKYDCIPSFEMKVKEAMSKAIFEEEVVSYIPLQKEDITVNNIQSLSILEPFGQGFDRPLYGVCQVEVINKAILKNVHLKLQLKLNGFTFVALWFNYKKDCEIGDIIDVVGELSVNTYKGFSSVQMMIKDIIKE